MRTYSDKRSWAFLLTEVVATLSLDQIVLTAGADPEPGDVLVKSVSGGNLVATYEVATNAATDAQCATAVIIGDLPRFGKATVVSRLAEVKDALVGLPTDATVKAKLIAALAARHVIFRKTHVS